MLAVTFLKFKFNTKMEQNNKKHCYNSWSCMISVLIIAFALGFMIYDITISKPQFKKDLNEIKVEIKDLNKKVSLIKEQEAQNAQEVQNDTVISLDDDFFKQLQ